MKHISSVIDMKRYMNVQLSRAILIALLVLSPIRVFADFNPIKPGGGDNNDIGGDSTGVWTPTNAGLVIQLNPGDQFRFSTVIGGVEYFVCDYNDYKEGIFNYKYPQDTAILKLIPRNNGEPPAGSLWTVGAPLERKKNQTNYALVNGIDGILYTMWSDEGRTFVTEGDDYSIKTGKLMRSDVGLDKEAGFCDVAFAIPTVRSRVNMDPKNSLERGYPFDGQMGVDEQGNVWREVYWFNKSRKNGPYSYAAMSLTAFNTSTGKAYQINAKNKHAKTSTNLKRMLFRLYIVAEHPFETCPNSYFFAHDEQNFLKFLRFTALPIIRSDSTTARKIYTHDFFHCMERIGDTKYYQTGLHQISANDSVFYYVGKNNKFYSDQANPIAYISNGTTALSQFTNIRQLRIRPLANESTPFIAPVGAYGRIVVDTTSNDANHGASFDPVGYFFRTSSNVNVPMVQVDDTTWMTSTMWHIEGEYMNLKGIVMLYSGTSFSSTDPGVAIAGWSDSVLAPTIPVFNHPELANAAGKSGWARIHTNRPTTNGGIEFVLANTTGNYIEYSNNGHFGVELPKQYPMEGSTKVILQAPQLLQGYTFYGWNTTADTTTGTLLHVGDTIDFEHLPVGVSLDGYALKLYAKAKYAGSINVAISFLKEDGKRYFLTHPNTSAPRYARARSFEDWTNVWQGMYDAENNDPNYLSTYKIIGKTEGCEECEPNEYVLDPHNETMHGGEDSLIFYENFHPENEEYIGLYYEDPNTVLANNTWAGLFLSSEGWPTPSQACIDSTRLSSTHYLTGYPNHISRQPRNSLPPNIKYNALDNQFDGVEGDGTDFMISGVGVVDAHYVILPDTTNVETPWTDSITFAFHENHQITENVWSKLIGKQLLAQMKVGKDTIYFHPNQDKIITEANALMTSRDFRLTHKFEYIRDTRVEALHVVAPEDKPTATGTDNASFQCTIISGENSPKDVQSGSKYIDIVDTLRVWLRPTESSKIKEYYGRWNSKNSDVHVRPDGSRYRDILVTTKTYHYGPEQTELRLVPAKETYSFGSVGGLYDDVNFTLQMTTWHELLDKDGNLIREEIISTKDTTSLLDLTSATFSLKFDTIFSKETPTRTGIRLTTIHENTTSQKWDTLTVTTTVTIGSTPIELTAKVPLLQVSTIGTELIWSVDHSGTRYFIFATSTGLRYQTFPVTNSRLQYNGNELIIGSQNAANDNAQYITPWEWTDENASAHRLILKTKYGVNRFFSIFGETTPGVDADTAHASILTFVFDTTYTNPNGNYEEMVYLKYLNDKWLNFDGEKLMVGDSAHRSLFSWGYMLPEYYMLNNGTYPSKEQEDFGYNSTRVGSVQTRYQAYLDHSMLLNNQLVYVARTNEADIADLIDAGQQWKTNYTPTHVRDSRFDVGASGLSISTDPVTLMTSITPSGTSPLNVKYNNQYVNIVDTLDFRISLQADAPEYRFNAWNDVSTLEDAHVKIPLIRRTYHEIRYDSIGCTIQNDEYNYAFPSFLREGVSADSLHTFILHTKRYKGRNVYNVNNQIITAIREETGDSTNAMNLTNLSMSEIRLVDEYGNKPTWCQIIDTTKNTLTVKCLSNGIRSPRIAYIYFAYIVMVEGRMRFVNFRLTVSQASYFQYANNQTLIHTAGASGDPLIPNDGRQYAHENKRILYYYNPAPYNEPDQYCELPVRERGFYGWWRWYREGKDQNGVDVGDTDIPDSVWYQPPRNIGHGSKKYKFPFRIIGDSVKVLNPRHGETGQPDSIKKLVTMGRYTVFHYPSKDYGTKLDPPAESPWVKPPFNEDTVTYVVDISNYYDNLPLSTKEGQKNQIDTAMLDTIKRIYEPTLSLREVFELHPWTEMAERLDTFKYTVSTPWANQKYLEDHVVMAPIGNRLLLQTEQRYDTIHLGSKGHSESLLGYYMRDDNWNKTDGDWTFTTPEARKACQDTMIWCGGWDAKCGWYTYNPSTNTYDTCSYSTTDDDFLQVPAKPGITLGHEFDTVYYCLRSRSMKTTNPADPNSTVPGDYWFNICRYKIIYHSPNKYGPKAESKKNGVTKALITNDEIEEDYEVLERLDFDYTKPGSEYHVYSHPLPWEDASYGYSYPLSSSAIQNRYHDEKDFPGPGEYALINKIKYSNWWHTIEQHGGAANGYMIYCDGMSDAGQVAALTLKTNLCEGQKLYFSGYLANASNQTANDKARPNFTFSVQGSHDGKKWEDISSYMTGDIEPVGKNKTPAWYQIFFPIEHEHAYEHFRVRIFNMAANFDGNDFVIDDMCIFATKPPLIAYQAQTKCVEQIENDSIIHVVLRVDYQGFIDESYNNAHVHYTVEQMTLPDSVISFVSMIDRYLNEDTIKGAIDTLYGWIPMPAHNYTPTGTDSIFINLNKLAERFETSYNAHKAWEEAGKVEEEPKLFRQGYIYENLDGNIRPVLYVVHKAKMSADNKYKVRMSLNRNGLMSSDCALTSNLKVTNRMMLMLDGIEQEKNQVEGICGNVTYDLSLRVRGTLIQDSVAPIDLTGSCMNDWLLYGDTARESSYKRYGYYYSDIVKVVKDILRYEPASGESNANQFARTLRSVNRNVMNNIRNKYAANYLETADEPYVVLSNLVNNGFLQLYQSDLMASITPGDSVKYVVFPILGTGSDDMNNKNMEVCPTPLVIVLKAKTNELGAPMIIGGLHRDSTQLSKPIIVLADAIQTSSGIAVPVDSIRNLIGVRSVELTSTDDPNFREGVHHLEMTPDRSWPGDVESYYRKGDTILLTPSSSNNYTMRPGYNYTYYIEMVTQGGDLNGKDGCPIGGVSFTISYVPDYLRWNPQNADNNQWNNPDNWLGITQQNKAIHDYANFAPLPSTKVIIPAMTDGMPYPTLTVTDPKDSVQEVGFSYNICDAIRFLPGAAIGQQQLLTYNNAIIDMNLQQKKWAFRSAPVAGMLSGDIFMSNADQNANSNPWEVGAFDMNGRSYKFGGTSFWLSVYNKSSIQKGVNGNDEENATANGEWSKVTNAMTEPLSSAQGWAVYSRNAANKPITVRLPKQDDIYYYFDTNGDRVDNLFEDGLNAMRDTQAGGSGKAGKFAFHPDSVGDPHYELSNGAASEYYVFGNPTMGYIDIWGFIADNNLVEEFSYLDESGEASKYLTINKAAAEAKTDTISTIERYLPPMRVMVIKASAAGTKLRVKLMPNRIVTSHRQIVRPLPTPAPAAPAPAFAQKASGRSKGIMTITAINPVSARCVSRLLIGQGYHDDIRAGEDAMLATINIDNFTTYITPSTPFNIYASEGEYGLCIDLRDEVLNIPLSFYLTRQKNLSFDPVTHLWFSGVNSIDGQLVLYDTLMGTERMIIDGICLDIETPELNHEKRYYIRRRGYKPNDGTDPIATDINAVESDKDEEKAIKIMRNGHVYILRNGHVYTMFGQKMR